MHCRAQTESTVMLATNSRSSHTPYLASSLLVTAKILLLLSKTESAFKQISTESEFSTEKESLTLKSYEIHENRIQLDDSNIIPGTLVYPNIQIFDIIFCCDFFR